MKPIVPPFHVEAASAARVRIFSSMTRGLLMLDLIILCVGARARVHASLLCCKPFV